MGYGPPTKTVADVMRVVKRQFGDESGVQLEDADIFGWIDDAQTRINLDSKVLKAKSSQAATPGTGSYTFPAMNILSIDSIHYEGRRVPNMSFAQAEETVSQADPAGTLTSNEPTLWYEWGGTFTFFPVPDSAGTIEVFYTVKPTAIVDETSDLSLPDDFFMDVVNYVLLQAYEMDEDWEARGVKEQQFNDSLLRRGEQARDEQNMTYPVITVVNDYYY